MAGTNYLDIDVSDAQAKIQALSLALSPKELKQLNYRVVSRTGKKVKGIVSTDVPKRYHIKKNIVARDIRRPRMGNTSGVSVSCSIPIEGKRHIIGGNTFPARGGRHGWNGIVGGKRYKIATQIVKGQQTILPETMGHQGGTPPFRNLGARKLNNATYNRAAGAGFPPKNLPLVRVVGLAVPQMPLNRAEDDVQKDIRDFMIKRIDQEFANIMRKCR